MADLNQLARLRAAVRRAVPGHGLKPLIAELKARVIEELDYGLEADAQRAFAAAYAGDPRSSSPGWSPAPPRYRVGVAGRHAAARR